MGTDTASALPTPPPGLAEWSGFVFFKAGWALQEAIEAALAPVGLRARHFVVMTLAAADAGLSQQDMSRAMSVDPTTMVELVDALVDAGLATRGRNPNDRRRSTLFLTPKGSATLNEARRIVADAEDQFFDPLTASERRALASMTTRLMAPHWFRAPR